MNLVLFDDVHSEHLLPLTYTRPVGEWRIGMLRISEKWGIDLGCSVSHLPYRSYLRERYPVVCAADTIYVNGACLPDEVAVQQIRGLAPDSGLVRHGRILAMRTHRDSLPATHEALQHPGSDNWEALNIDFREQADGFRMIAHPEDIFVRNGEEISRDRDRKKNSTTFVSPSPTNRLIASENIFLEEGARVEHAYLNATDGPIYLSAGSLVMEGAMIRGPFYLGPYSEVKMGAKIYGATSIGPHCKVGGEVSNSVILGYSNKGHEGFMGQAVLGCWCNWGADTNNSNLKNNYETVKMWDEHLGRFRQTGLQFAGLVMGDHAKTGINTMLNTGTVIGVGANVFGAGFPRNFLPSFCWGGAQGLETFRFDKFTQTATRVMERRKLLFDAQEEQILRAVFDETQPQRTWERGETAGR